MAEEQINNVEELPPRGRGRPRGSRNKRTLVLQALADKDAKAIVQGVIKDALKGDATARRIVVDRIWPAPRSRSINLSLPEITDIASLDKAYDAVLQSAAMGEITVDEASTIGQLLESRRRASDLSGLVDRVEALERNRERSRAA